MEFRMASRLVSLFFLENKKKGFVFDASSPHATTIVVLILSLGSLFKDGLGLTKSTSFQISKIRSLSVTFRKAFTTYTFFHLRGSPYYWVSPAYHAPVTVVFIWHRLFPFHDMISSSSLSSSILPSVLLSFHSPSFFYSQTNPFFAMYGTIQFIH